MLIIRPATDHDREAISQVHDASVREVCSAWYTPAQILAWRSGRGPESVPIHEHDMVVAEEDGRILGFGELSAEESEICAVYVAPDALRRGVGAAILAELEAVARRHGLDSLQLCSTLGAVEFYERHGFESLRETIFTLRAGVDLPCFEMRKSLSRPVADTPEPPRAIGHRR